MKNKKLLLLGGSVCLLFSLFFGCGERAGEKEYNKALASVKNGDWARAQGQLEKAIRKLSDSEKRSVANNQLGIILWKLDKPELSIEAFSESCRLSEDLTGANLNLAIALFHTGQLEQSEFEFTKILSEQADHTTAHSFMSLIQMQKNDWKGASKEITTGLRTNPNNPAGQNALALTELHLNKNSDAAIKRLTQLTTAYPDYAPAAFNLAVIYDQWLGNKKSASRWFYEYLSKADGDSAQIATAKQAIARLEGTNTPTTTQPSARTYPDAAARFITEGSKLHAAKKYDAAVKQYEKAIKADPSKKTGYYNLGLSYYALKKYPDAAQACTHALKIDPRFADARYMLALAYGQQGKWSDAEREAQMLRQLDSGRGDTLLKYISKTRK